MSGLESSVVSPPCLILAGMHRSGTSLLGKFLQSSGINMGEQLLGANESNKYGHFEDVEILDYHREILIRENRGEEQWVLGKPKITVEDRRRAMQYVAKRRACGVAWGWKEPRTCVFLDMWSEIVPEAKYLFVYRSASQVLDSLGRRHSISRWDVGVNSKLTDVWSFYNQCIIECVQKAPGRCLLAPLDVIVEKPVVFCRRLSDFVGQEFNPETFVSCFDSSVLNVKRPLMRRVSIGAYWRAAKIGRLLRRAAAL